MKATELHTLDTFTQEVQAQYDNFCKEQLKSYDWMDELYYLEHETEQEALWLQIVHQRQWVWREINEDGIMVMSVLEWVELFFFLTATDMGLTFEKTQEYISIIQKKYTRTGKCPLMKFHYSLVFKHINTNFYLTYDDVFLKSEFEFDILTQRSPKSIRGNYLCVNLNGIASMQFEEKFGTNALQKQFLNKAERDVIKEIRDKDFSKDKILVKMKQGQIDMIQTIGKENDLNRLKELSDKYEDSKIGFQKYKWKKKHITIETRKKYDNSTS